MMIDFKIVRQTETLDGIEVVARFYKGNITMKNERSSDGIRLRPVTRYRRMGLLLEKTFYFNKQHSVETALRNELKKYTTYISIPEQV